MTYALYGWGGHQRSENDLLVPFMILDSCYVGFSFVFTQALAKNIINHHYYHYYYTIIEGMHTSRTLTFMIMSTLKVSSLLCVLQAADPFIHVVSGTEEWGVNELRQGLVSSVEFE